MMQSKVNKNLNVQKYNQKKGQIPGCTLCVCRVVGLL